MSTLSLLRVAGGRTLSRVLSHGFRQQALTRATPVMSVVPRKSFTVSPALGGRVYGPLAESEKEDEQHHWIRERWIALALLPIIPAALAYPHPVMDTVLCAAMVLHSHWRLQGVATDYIHGETLPKIHQPLILVLSILVFGSLSYFNYYDVGFAKAIQMLYTQL